MCWRSAEAPAAQGQTSTRLLPSPQARWIAPPLPSHQAHWRASEERSSMRSEGGLEDSMIAELGQGQGNPAVVLWGGLGMFLTGLASFIASLRNLRKGRAERDSAEQDRGDDRVQRDAEQVLASSDRERLGKRLDVQDQAINAVIGQLNYLEDSVATLRETLNEHLRARCGD